MARSTWGSIRAKSKGVWEIRYPKPQDPDSKNRRQGSETIRGTKKQAEQRLAELRVECEGVDCEMTLDQFWRLEYWPSCSDLAPSTRAGYESTYQHAIKPVFGDMNLKDIGPKRIQSWIDAMTYGAARTNRAVLRSILSVAETKELVSNNAARKRFKLPKKTPENACRTINKAVFTQDELDDVFIECRGEWFEAPFILAAFGGARREEACGVMAQEIEFEDVDELGLFALVPISRGVQCIKGEIIVGGTKNPHSARLLVVPPPYADRLKQLCDITIDAGESWLLDDGFGNVQSPDTMASAYRRWFQRVPFRYVPFANLRNSYATVMHSMGIDLTMVQKLMGHKNMATTFDHYDRPGREEFMQVITRAMRNA